MAARYSSSSGSASTSSSASSGSSSASGSSASGGGDASDSGASVYSFSEASQSFSFGDDYSESGSGSSSSSGDEAKKQKKKSKAELRTAAVEAITEGSDGSSVPKGVLIPVGGGSAGSLQYKVIKAALKVANKNKAKKPKKTIVVKINHANGDWRKKCKAGTGRAQKLTKESRLGKAWYNIGADEVYLLRYKDQPRKADRLLLEQASIVWMGGGGQSSLFRTFTPAFIRSFRLAYFDGCVVGGSSAGAAVLNERLYRPRVGYEQGLAMNPVVNIDTHYLKRKRQGRLAKRVKDWQNVIGIGLEENGVYCTMSEGGTKISVRAAKSVSKKKKDGRVAEVIVPSKFKDLVSDSGLGDGEKAKKGKGVWVFPIKSGTDWEIPGELIEELTGGGGSSSS